MAPKKKNKTNKLANMFEDERLRYMQHKAAMEEEASRRKQQIIASYMKIKLKHEETFSRLNSAKINQQWRCILRQIKCENLKEDISSLQQRFEDVLNHKNELISCLLSDYEKAEFQYSLQFQEHMETISKFLKLHNDRLANVYLWYTSQLKETRDQNVKSTREMIMTIENDLDDIKAKRATLRQDHTKKLETTKSKFDDEKNDLQTKLMYRSVKVEEKYANEFAQLQQEYNAILEQYKSNTESKVAHYRMLSEKDDADTKEIIRNYEIIHHYNKRIMEEKAKLDDLKKRHQTEKSNLISRKTKLTEELKLLRKQYEQNCKIDRSQLKLLVNTSNTVIKDLNNALQKGEQISHLLNQCSKLTNEKQDEFPIQVSLNEDENNTFSNTNKRLQTFWKIQNNVRITNERLAETRLQAQEENHKLRQLLRYRMFSIRRSQSVPRKCGF